jgi:hypothetical protein
MARDRQTEARVLQSRASTGSGSPTRTNTSDEQSSIVRNPAPDASPPSAPSASHKFTVNS